MGLARCSACCNARCNARSNARSNARCDARCDAQVPWLFVSTADHLEHHKRLTAHYAAPTFSIDRILACVFGKPADWDSKFESAEQAAHAPMYIPRACTE